MIGRICALFILGIALLPGWAPAQPAPPCGGAWSAEAASRLGADEAAAPLDPAAVSAALLALDDSRPDDAADLLAPLLAAHPHHPGLRLARAEIQYAADPQGFVADAAAAPPPGPCGGAQAGGPPPSGALEGEGAPGVQGPPSASEEAARAAVSARWDAALRLYIRARHERAHYRGDGQEEPDAFLARMEALAQATAAEIVAARLPDPWAALIGRETDAWLGRPLEPLRAEGGADPEAAAPPLRPFTDWMILGMAERGIPPDARAFAFLLKAPSPWGQRAALQDAARRVDQVPWMGRVGVWRALAPAITEPTLQDDLTLALAREILQRPGGLDEALSLLEPLATGPWNNSVTNATRSLGATLRRQGEDDALLAAYEGYNARIPPWGEPIRRQYGRALYRLGRYDASVTTLTLLVESPWGQGRDYLYVADATRFVTSPESAISLVDFASAVRERELIVEGALKGWAPQVTAVKIRLFELGATLRHARIFPATFVSMASLVLLDALALALGLVVLAAFPRLTARAWRWGAALAALVFLLQLGWAAAEGAAAVGAAAAASWVGYGAVRAFSLGGAAVVIAAAAGLPGLGLLRAAARRARGGSARRLVWALVSLGGAAGILAALHLPLRGGLGESPYLARLPGALMGAVFGVTGAPGWEVAPTADAALHGLGLELLMRGLVLGLLAWGIITATGARRGERRHRLAVALAALGAAALSAALTAGLSAPPGDAFWLALADGLVLSWLAASVGLDAAILARVGMALLVGAP